MQQHITAIADSFKVGESEANCLLTMLVSESTSKDGWFETSRFDQQTITNLSREGGPLEFSTTRSFVKLTDGAKTRLNEILSRFM